MNYYTEGTVIKLISMNGVNTQDARVEVGHTYRVNEVDFCDSTVKVGFNTFLDFEDIEAVQQPSPTQRSIEQIVAQKAIHNYRQAQEDNKRIEGLLKTKTYHLNDYVVDVIFGIGKIVGWDEEYEYYRVRFNDNLRFIGREEDILMPYVGEVPQELSDHDPNVVNYVWGFYLDDTVVEDMES